VLLISAYIVNIDIKTYKNQPCVRQPHAEPLMVVTIANQLAAIHVTVTWVMDRNHVAMVTHQGGKQLGGMIHGGTVS